MNVQTFAEWLRRQGHHIYHTGSTYWYNAGPRVLQAFPYHWLIQPDPRELRELFLRHQILALRYSTSLDAGEGMISYHVVLEDLNYSLETLRNQARNGIRRGLEKCRIEQVSFDRLAEEGWRLQQDTLERQNRLNSMKQSEWKTICLSAEGLPGFEAWAAVVDDQLAASIITCRIDDKGYVPYAQSHRDYLGLHVNNALFYTASRDILSRPGVTGIFYCLHSLDAPESVDEFKLRMGFAAKPVRQRVALHPILTPIATPSTYDMVQKKSNSPFTAKVEGMLRFYLRGKLPLENQDWPKCLEERKREILSNLQNA